MIDEPLTTLAQESEEDALRRVQQLAQERLHRKAELDPRSALRRGFAAGIDNLQSSAYGLTAMAGDAIGSERLAEYGIEGYQRNADQAADDLRGVTVDLRDVDGAGALGEFVAVNLGMMAPDLLAAATGAGVAAVAGKKLTQKAATELIRKRIDDKAAALVAGGVARDRAQELATQTTAAAISRAAGMTGSVAAMSGIFAGRQAGSLAEETGDVHTLPSAVSGVLQGSLEMVPFFRLAKRFGGDELAAEATAGIRDRAMAIAKKAALASADGAVTEGITETLQSVIEQATVSYVTDNDHLFSDEHLEEMLVAGASGALLGGILGAGAGTVGGIRSRVDEREIGRQRIAQYEVDLAEAATSDLHDISSFERRRTEAEDVIAQQRERIIRRAEYEYASGNNEALIDAKRELQQLDRAMQEFELLSRVKEYRVQGSQQREGVSSPDIDLGRTAGLDVNLDDDSASSEGLDIDLSDDPPANVQSLQETQEQQPDDIVAPDGNPFRRYRVAQRKQKDDQEIVRVPNGFVLRPSALDVESSDMIDLGDPGPALDVESPDMIDLGDPGPAVVDSPALDIDLGLKEINDLDVESPDLIDLRLENLNDPETPRVSWSERLRLTQDQDTEQNQKSNQAHLQRRIRAQKQIQKNRQIDVDNDDILMAVAKLGGIDTDIENDLQGRLPKIKTPFGVTGLDRPGKGLTLDEIAERLLPYGYIPETDIGNGVDSRILLDLMERAAAGGDVRSNHMDADDYMNQMFEDQAEAEQAYNEQLADQFLELYPEFENSYLEKNDADSLPEEYYAAELEEATSRRLTELVDDLDRIGVKRDRIIATIEAMAKAGDSTADIMHELFVLLEIEREEAAKRRSNESSPAPEETLLESYTNDDIVQAEQAERERQQATAAEQRRADQQATADNFQLTGSNREADQAAAAGQQDLLGTSSANDARGASNTVFTADAAQAARELLKKKLGNLNSGLDPEVIQAGITLAGFHIEAGARSFADYTARMVEDLGEGVRPYLRSWYESVRYYPGFDAEGMSSAQEIERYLAVEDATAESATLPEGIPEEVANDDTSANNRYVDPVQQAIADNFGQIKNNLALKRVVAQATNKKPREVTLPELKQAQEQYEAVMAEQARDVVELSDDSRNTYNQLVRLHQSMPNLNVRSSDSMARQAYSTPAPLAFVASKLGGLTNNGKTWDNSSGHGMLLLRTDKASAVPNELDPERFARLQFMGFANATNQNALDAPKKPQYPHVIANPPFGKMDGDYTVDGARLTTIDHALVAQALESMTDNGTASFIIGAGRQTADESAADRRFYQWLYGNYRVVDHVEVDGSLYTKQGASWPVRIISIRGREASDKLGPKPELIQRIDNWDKLYDHYEGVMGAIADGGIERSESISQRRDKGAEAKLSRIRNSGEGSNQSTSRSTNTGSAGRAANANGNQQQSSVGTAPESQSDGARSDGSNRNVGNTQSGATVQSESRTTENVNSRTNKSNDAGRSNQLTSDQLQSEYKSASSLSSLGALVPSNMRDNLTDFYNRLRSEVGDIDQYVKDRLGYTNDAEFQKAFMGLQVDAIASAIYNHDVNGQGIIIADQTGIGKGRQAAGIIRYARRQGKVPVFVTVKPNLFTDMFDDLHDIGETDINPFIMNADTGITVQDKNGNKKIKNKSLTGAKQKAMFADIISSGKLPEGTNVLFATYSQITTPNVQRDVFEALADKAWFVLDEAHNMAGNQFSIKKGGLKVLTGAGFVKSMTDKAPTTYLSATYAKRPDNMSAFTKTALSDAIPEQNADSENSRFADMSDPFAEAIASGGAPLQSVIAAELTKKGQLIRRERSFDGISIEAEIDNDNATLHRAIADQLVIGLRGIYDADRAFHNKDVKELKSIAKKAGAAAKAAGNRASSTVDHTSFSAVIHNYINQMLLGLKADYAADKAIALHKQGIKPVIALENTMESFIKDNTEMMAPGDEFSLDYRDVLHRALDRTRRITTTVNGKSDTTDVPLSELSLEAQVKYAAAAEAIDKLQLEGIPLSPIDYIKNKMEQAGIKVGEITGRTIGLDYSSGSTPTLYKRSKAEKDDRRGTVNDFNNGALDALVLNVAGSTGLSIHNSTKLPESEQKKRHMIVVQMPLDINVMMQMLGRINRTGQRTEPDMLPSYTILGASVPAEKRPMAVALNKLASLNANTSANTEGSTTFEALNFFNEYGDEVVNDYLNSNIDLAVKLDLNNELSGEGSATPGIAKKATGRMAAYATLPDQEAFYKAVEEEYKELIEYKDKIGDNKLKSSNLDLQARILESRTIHEDKKAKQTTAIAGNATAHKVSARQTTKPPDAKTVKTLIDKSLNGKNPQEAMNKLLDKVVSKDRAIKQIQKYDDALNAFNEALPGRSVAAENVTEAFAAVGDNASDKLKRAYENFQQVKYSRDTLKAQARNDIAELSANWPIGKPVNVSPSKDEDSYLGVITGYIIKPPSSKQNPLARSQVKVEIALASPTGRIKLPASKAYGSGKTDPLVTAADSNLTVEDIFDSEQSGDVYENRIIITGNLVAAIDSVGKGQITTFTSADGKKHTGLLLPRSYKGDFDAIGDDQFIITNTQAGLAMLKKEGDALTTKSGDVKVIRQSQGAYEVQLAKSKSALAAQVRTSPRVKNQTGDFYTSPSLPHYTASVRANNIENVVNVIQRVGAEFVLPESKRAQYVEQGGNEKALPGSFDNDSFRRKQTAGGLTAAKAKKTVKAIQRRWNNGPTINVVDSINDVPYLRDQYKDDNSIMGVYRNTDQSVYIIAGAHKNQQDVERTLLHEVQHFATRQRYGKEAVSRLAEVGQAIQRAGGIQNYVRKHNVDYDYAWYDQEFANAGLNEDQRLAKHVDELLADMAANGTTGIKSAARRAIAAIRRWLRSMGFNLTASLPNDLLVRMLNETQKVLNNKADPAIRPIRSRATNMHRVWHGSPHRFDKFSTDSINTGDGSSRRKGEGSYNEDMFRRTPQQVIEQTRTQTDQLIKDSNVGIRRWLKRNFTKEGLTNDKAFQLKIKSDAMKGAGELEVAALVHDFEKTLTKAYGKKRYNQIAKSDLEYINEYLGADPQARNSFNLDPEVKGMADIMRSYIDRQSADMIAGINELVQLQISNLSSTQLNAMNQYFATQGASGRVPADIMKNLNLMQTIQGNIGQYLNRSYAAFNDPDWKDKALRDTQLISRAESFIAQENPTLTPDEVTGAVRAILQSAADSGSFMTMISKGTKIGSKDISITRRRKNVPPIIRELLGEYKDPKLNFANSVSKMQWYNANQQFLLNLRKQGEGEFLFTKPTGEYDTKVAGDNSDTMNPLNGMYSTTDFAQGMIDAVDAFEGSDFMRTLIGLNSMVKYGKTILSPTTQFRNFQSAALFTVMNGHFDWSKTGKAWKSTVSDLVTKDSAWRDYTTKLTRLGVLHDNPYASELRLAMQDIADMDTYAQGPKQGIKRFGRKMADIYAAGDNFWKVVGFENEKENLMNSGMAEADAETIAANRIRNGYPTYSMVPRAIKKIRRWPLIGTFVSFPYESMRTTYNQIGFMKEDLAAGRKSLATKRMVGMAIATAASYAVSKATMAYFGIDEEDKEAILAQMPPWSRNSQLAFTGKDENGSPQYLDLSYLDPYTYLKKPITALFNGNNVGIDKKVVDAMTEVLAPFISPDIAATALVEILMNKRVGGGNVYNEQDTPPRQAAAILHHVFDATRPGVFNNIERTILALEGDVSRSGVEYTLGQEALGFVGHRVTTLNTRQALIYRAYEFNDAIRDSTAILSRVAGQQNRLSESEIQSAYDSMIRARGKAFRKMNRLVDGAKQLGVPESDIKELLSTARVSKANITALMNGDTPEWEMSKRFAQSAQRRAVLTATSNQRRREIDQVMEQRKRIIQRLQEANRQLVDAGRS